MSDPITYKGLPIEFDEPGNETRLYITGDDVPRHDFDVSTDFCTACGVPRTAVVDRIVIDRCGLRPRP